MINQPQRMLQTLSTKFLIWMLAISSIFFVICVILASTSAPKMIGTESTTFKGCKSETFNCISSNSQQEFLVKVTKVNKENNYIYFKLIPKLKNNKETEVRMNFTITDNKEKDTILEDDSSYTLSNDKFPITHLISHINEENSSFDLRLKVFFNEKNTDLLQLKFEINFLSKPFYIYLLTTKYVFFSYMLMCLILFLVKTRKMTYRYLPFETVTSLIMCISVLIFNEPLIGAYSEFSEISAISVSVFCNVQFICSLVLYWLFMLKKLNNPYCKKIITLVEFIFISSLFAMLFVIYVYVQSNLKYDTSYNWEKDLEGARKIIYQVVISILVLFAFWMFVLMLMSLRKWRDDSFTYREKVYWGFNYALIVISFVFIGLGYLQKLEYGQILLIIVSLYNIFFSVSLLVSTPELSLFNNWMQDIRLEDSRVVELESHENPD